jgi:hypothetical protein
VSDWTVQAQKQRAICSGTSIWHCWRSRSRSSDCHGANPACPTKQNKIRRPRWRYLALPRCQRDFGIRKPVSVSRYRGAAHFWRLTPGFRFPPQFHLHHMRPAGSLTGYSVPLFDACEQLVTCSPPWRRVVSALRTVAGFLPHGAHDCRFLHSQW